MKGCAYIEHNLVYVLTGFKLLRKLFTGLGVDLVAVKGGGSFDVYIYVALNFMHANHSSNYHAKIISPCFYTEFLYWLKV